MLERADRGMPKEEEVRPLGRGSLHAELHGRAWCWQGRWLRRHYQRHLPCEQANSAEEKLIFRARLPKHLRSSGHPPLEDARGILHVPWNNYGQDLCVGIFFGGARSWVAGDGDHHWIAADLLSYWHSTNLAMHVWLYLLKCSSA